MLNADFPEKMVRKVSEMKALLGAGVGLICIFIVFGVLSYYDLRKTSQDDMDAPESLDIDLQEATLAQIDASNLYAHIHELLRIKRSVLTQLRELEQKCSAVSQEVTELMMTIETLKGDISKLNSTALFLKSSNKYQEIAQDELKRNMSPKIVKPLRLTADWSDSYVLPAPRHSHSCTMDACFDYSRCPLTSGFPVYVDISGLSACENDTFAGEIGDALKKSPYAAATTASQACLFIDFACNASAFEKLKTSENWMGDGRNHLVFLGRLFTDAERDFGRAMVSQAAVKDFRRGFDVQGILLNDLEEDDKRISHLPLMTPARRKRLLYFSGNCRDCNTTHHITQDPLIKTLIDIQDMASSATGIELLFECKTVPAAAECRNDTWCMCELRTAYESKLAQSTFSLVIWQPRMDPLAVYRVLLGLKTGAIPVILGAPILPLDENLDWHRIAVQLPCARASELYSILYSIRDEDILEYRNQGRKAWQNYFSSPDRFSAAILDTIRSRLSIPAAPANEVVITEFLNFTYQSAAEETMRQDIEENVGPVESPYPSDTFQRNFTSTTLDRYAAWNDRFDVNSLMPSSPFSPDLPSDAQFRGSEFGFRPISGGAGGSGNEFSEAIGGNRPREQFTIVILTYQRETILSGTVARLHNLPYLNKVVIVWNSPMEPSDLLTIPKIHVPVVILRARVNSLNNRFLPYPAIETEAILSMDDDIQLRHDEIVFAFRVWRENRDRIVGFPARYHAHDSEHDTWLYNSNYTCEYSMVLTGAAFIHKYYTFLYTREMPAAIRAKVDEFMNCEDIAMNFLVSHVTRKPPIKVTSRWTFKCQDCPISLWEDESHFTERHICMEFFKDIYGYIPIKNSQFRADSVLFKTRIPLDKQKCFKSI